MGKGGEMCPLCWNSGMETSYVETSHGLGCSASCFKEKYKRQKEETSSFPCVSFSEDGESEQAVSCIVEPQILSVEKWVDNQRKQLCLQTPTLKVRSEFLGHVAYRRNHRI